MIEISVTRVLSGLSCGGWSTLAMVTYPKFTSSKIPRPGVDCVLRVGALHSLSQPAGLYLVTVMFLERGYSAEYHGAHIKIPREQFKLSTLKRTTG